MNGTITVTDTGGYVLEVNDRVTFNDGDATDPTINIELGDTIELYNYSQVNVNTGDPLYNKTARTIGPANDLVTTGYVNGQGGVGTAPYSLSTQWDTSRGIIAGIGAVTSVGNNYGVSQTYTGVASTGADGMGTGARFNVVTNSGGGITSVAINSGGSSGYKVAEVITIAGDLIGGTAGTHDITFPVTTLSNTVVPGTYYYQSSNNLSVGGKIIVGAAGSLSNEPIYVCTSAADPTGTQVSNLSLIHI